MGQPAQAWVVNPAGGGLRQSTTFAAGVDETIPAGNGRTVIAATGGGLVLIDAATGAVQELIPLAPTFSMGGVGLAGSRIAVSTVRNGGVECRTTAAERVAGPVISASLFLLWFQVPREAMPGTTSTVAIFHLAFCRLLRADSDRRARAVLPYRERLRHGGRSPGFQRIGHRPIAGTGWGGGHAVRVGPERRFTATCYGSADVIRAAFAARLAFRACCQAGPGETGAALNVPFAGLAPERDRTGECADAGPTAVSAGRVAGPELRYAGESPGAWGRVGADCRALTRRPWACTTGSNPRRSFALKHPGGWRCPRRG